VKLAEAGGRCADESDAPAQMLRGDTARQDVCGRHELNSVSRPTEADQHVARGVQRYPVVSDLQHPSIGVRLQQGLVQSGSKHQRLQTQAREDAALVFNEQRRLPIDPILVWLSIDESSPVDCLGETLEVAQHTRGTMQRQPALFPTPVDPPGDIGCRRYAGAAGSVPKIQEIA